MSNQPNTQQGQIDVWKQECHQRGKADLARAWANAGAPVQTQTRQPRRKQQAAPAPTQSGGGVLIRWCLIVAAFLALYWYLNGSMPWETP